jgi:hypothetical protein
MFVCALVQSHNSLMRLLLQAAARPLRTRATQHTPRIISLIRWRQSGSSDFRICAILTCPDVTGIGLNCFGDGRCSGERNGMPVLRDIVLATLEGQMSKTPKKSNGRSLAKPAKPYSPSPSDFDIVLGLIDAARTRAVAAVNTTLIELYWNIGEHISRKTAEEGWGQGTVEALAETIQRRYPGMTGYSARNLWRMSQFFETYRKQPKLSPLVTELSWTHNYWPSRKPTHRLRPRLCHNPWHNYRTRRSGDQPRRVNRRRAALFRDGLAVQGNYN